MTLAIWPSPAPVPRVPFSLLFVPLPLNWSVSVEVSHTPLPPGFGEQLGWARP